MERNNQPDERHEDLPKDDASIEILSESGDSHTRDSEWSIYSPSRSSIAGSEMSSIDFQKLSIDSKMSTIIHRDGRQFIERRDLDDGGLPYSAEFYLNGEVWKLSGEDCLLMSPRRYIAKVTIEVPVDLDGAIGFEQAVLTLLKHLKVEKVLVDEDLEECNNTKTGLVMVLDKLANESEENIDRKRDVILLHMLLRKHDNSLNMNFKQDLRNCSRLSSELLSKLDNYVTKALKLTQRNDIFGYLIDSSTSGAFINDAIQEALNRHRARLAAICPSAMKDKLKELPDDRILYITMDDMHLFADSTILDEAIFEAALPMIFSKFLTTVQEINEEQFSDVDPLSNRIFLYVCKSVQEVAEQLGTLINTDNAIIYSEALGWEVTDLQEESETSYSKCLRQQLQMLAKLANHFQPGGPFRTSCFPYEFKLFQNMDAIPEPVRIWLCLLDDCMKDLVQTDLDKMQMLSCFFKSYVSFVASEDFRSETLECLRTITHDVLRSLPDVTSSQHVRTTSESVTLEYYKMISCCLEKFPRQHFGKECDQIETTLQQVISKAMDMNGSSDEFSNVFKQLLNDLSDLQLEWFVQLTPPDKLSLLLRSQFIVPVKHECYKVEDLEGFVEMYKLLYNSEEIPTHYQLKAIRGLLQNLEKLASKQNWVDGKRLSDKERLDAMTVMINSIRSSLDRLNEQADFCRFEDFLLKMSKPCVPVIKEEVHDLPHSDAIGSDETLDPLLHRVDGSISKVLTRSLKKYETQFNKHITESEQLSREIRIEKIVSDVMSKINQRTKLATSWTEKFKRIELPKVLAGLSAVWSIIVSENGSSSEKMPKPSQLQISCVLNIFENNTDYSHQFLQLSTQQGKEFALGLTAAVLALYGHKVHIVCFNSNLTSINSLDWIKVFRNFSILSNISYESVEDIARERSKGVYEKYTTYLNECFGFEIYANNASEPENASEDERSVLLIEDVDIILQEKIMGMPFRRFVWPIIPGLGDLQSTLRSQRIMQPANGNIIDQLIKQSTNQSIWELRAFLDRPHSYTILEGEELEEVQHTNKTLLLKYLEAMEKKKFRERINNRQPTVRCYYKYGYLTLGYIPCPYPHVLKSFPLVLGFTSAPLNVSDTIMLNDHYGIYHSISESNVFQPIPTKFDSKKDFLKVDSKDDWMKAIIVAMNAAIDKNCLVLVFFKDAQEMEHFQKTQHLEQFNLNVTAIKTASNLEKLPEHNISADEICVLMVLNGYSPKDRQVHVIQTFFSDHGKEEDLIRKQAERSHSSGSYELILYDISNISRYFDDTNIKEEITYDLLLMKRRCLTVEGMKLVSALSLEQYNKFKKFLKL